MAKKPPESLKSVPQLYHEGWKRMHQRNQNFMACISAQTGKGKSYAALKIAEELDPNFSIDQVAFTPKQFIELVNDDSYGTGSVIVFDEAGVGISNRDWYSDANKNFGFVLQTWRHQNRGAIFTVPELSLIDKQAQNRLHGFMEAKKIDRERNLNKIRYKRVQTNPRTGKAYFKYFRRWDRETGRTKVYKDFMVGLPSEELQEAYEERKERFTDKVNEDAKDTFTPDEDDEVNAKEVAQEILAYDDSKIREMYVAENNGQKYFDRKAVEGDYGIGSSKSGRVKSLVTREIELEPPEDKE